MSIKKLLPLIGIIILIYILSTLNFTEIISVFSTLNPWYVLLSFCSIIPLVCFATFEWQLILKKHQITVSYWYAVKNIFIGYFYGFITPGGFGAYTRALYLKDETGESLQKCFVNILMFNTLDFIALLTLGVIGGFVLSSRFPHIVLPIFIVFLVLIFLLLFFIHKQTGKTVLQKLFRSKLLNPYTDTWNAQIEQLYAELPTFKDLAVPFSISMLGWVIWLSELYLISMLFAIHVSYVDFVLVVAMANVIASLPITIYGLGTREAALIGLFSVFAVNPANIVSLSLFWFVLIWLFPSSIGAGVTLYESRRQTAYSAR